MNYDLRSTRQWAACAALLFIGPCLAHAQFSVSTSVPIARTATVEFFSPQGSHKDVRQVQARFSAPMVAFGDPTLADPFDVQCDVSGKGRWADARNWIYDFTADVPGGIRCRFTLRAGIRALDGSAVGGRREFGFDTGGPSIRASFPRSGWEEIDEDQVFLLRLDAPADPSTISRHAHCLVDGLGERIPVEVLTGAARSQVLAQRAAFGYAYYQLLWKSGRQSSARVRDRSLEVEEAQVAVVRCRRQLPPATQVMLVWGSGIAAPSGIATTSDQSLAFRVRPLFTIRIECERANADAGCLPMLPIRVVFSAPVARESAQAIRMRFEDGTELAPSSAPGADPPVLNEVAFKGPHPAGRSVSIALPAVIQDDAGRSPSNADRYPLQIAIDDYPPLVKFAAEFGILESTEGGVLPVTLRNAEAEVSAANATISGQQLRLGGDARAISTWLQRVQEVNDARGTWQFDPKTKERSWREETGDRSVFEGAEPQALKSFTIAKPSGSRPAEVIGIPLGDPGLYVVEIASPRLGASTYGREATRYVSTAVLVTNLSVHFKWGREASRVWVTRLDSGAIVPDATVVISDFCSGAIQWEGRTDADGIAAIRTSLGEPHGRDRCWSYGPRPLLVMAALGDDASFTQSGWVEGIEPHSFGLPIGNAYAAAMSHTVLDRPLFRSGETVSMKHYLRRQQMDGVGIASGAAGKRKVRIQHLGSDQSYVLDADFGNDGVADQQWQIPKEARLGEYEIRIEEGKDDFRKSGSFQVQQYRLPIMRATVQGPARPVTRPREVTLDLHVAYLSGGGASELPVRLRTTVEAAPLRINGYEDYSFGGLPVTEGVVREAGHYFDFDPESPDQGPSQTKTQLLPLTLDANGAARVTIGSLPDIDDSSRLIAELEYPDPNGEMLTASGRVRLVPSSVQLGIRREGWVASDKQMRFRIVALDLDGKPISRQAVTATLFRSTAYSYRKRLIGGFYTYETLRETARIETKCAGVTNQQGLLLCEVAPGVSGEIRIRAESRDRAGNLAGATASIWVVGEGDWWFGGTQGDRMDVLPERKEYEAGDVARLQVRMPFRTATALVTVEREGVLESFVTRLSGRAPVVKVPIGPSYAPNVYVSVLAVRGRVGGRQRLKGSGDEQITALVDLNKPAYRLGTTAIRVGWRPHRLDVTVEPAAASFRVREKASVKIRVKRSDGGSLPASTEIALAAVDEALLELAPNPSWELLDAMMGERGLGVWTSTAQMQVVGKRHYGRKAVPHGGGGGRLRARELFESLLRWQARVKLDANGEAMVDIPLNDSLSSFRIVAIAHAGASHFGTGSASITTTQDLMLLSGLPPLVREGDRYDATFTVRNTTTTPMTVEVAPRVTPAVAEALATQQLSLAPGQARDIVWSVTAPVGHTELEWDVTAVDSTGSARDRVRVTESVVPAFPVRTYQATLMQLEKPLEMVLERPARAIPGRGGIEVNLRSSLGGSLDGVREFMSFYPYACIEQQLSSAVARRDSNAWATWTEKLPAFQDHDGLVRYFATEQLEGDDTLTSYVLAVADAAGYTIPKPTRDRMIAGLTGFVAGRITRHSALPTADLAIRKLAAIEALARHQSAQPAMLESITIEPQLWPTSAVLDWLSILDRIENVPHGQKLRQQADSILRSRLNFQGTTMGFSTERSDALWWLMISTDSNAARLLLTVADRPAWREDTPRLVRGLIGRQQRGHWNTTLANAWGVLAIEKFSTLFEATAVTGRTTVGYGRTSSSLEWKTPPTELESSLPWQEGKNSIAIRHVGTGSPWLMLRSQAALPLAAPLSTGYTIRRTVTPVSQEVPERWRRGDVMRVRLEIDAQSDMTWVVVDDPIPAGATILGSGLGGQSELQQRDERSEGWVWPAFFERRFEAFRAYYRFVPKGSFSVEYTVRLNNPGEFLLPATRVEAMYAPEMLGELPNAPVVVVPGS
ncbi:MAG: alpha-2-macroglobulin [Steroidobacteraceae bacterium]